MAFLLNLLLAVTLHSAAGAPAQSDEGQSSRFDVAVLRRDGIVIPFAAFDGKTWTSPWPIGLRYVEVPIDIQSVPGEWWGKAGPAAGMAAWVNGANRGPIRLSRPVVLPLMCGTRLGVRTDYKSEQPIVPPAEQPYPKDGLAISGSQTVDPIEQLSEKSPEWAAAAEFLREPVARAEQAAIGAFTDWKDPIPKAVRRATNVEIEALYRAPMDEAGWVAYYVESIKRYAPGPDDDGCGLVTSSSGWTYVDAKGRRRTHLTAHVTYCDRRGVTYMLPLGLIKARGRTYWVYQISGYDREGYVIARPTPNAVEMNVQYPAANCPQLNGR